MKNSEIIAIICIIVCAVIVVIEYIWLYVLARRQEAKTREGDEAHKKIMEMMEAIVGYPTQASLQTGVQALTEYIGDDMVKNDIVFIKLLELMGDETRTDREKQAICYLYEKMAPLRFYSSLLKGKNKYMKAYSCRMIADYEGEDQLPNIRKLLSSKNRDVVYNAAMALSELGDGESVYQFIMDSEKDHQYSYRIIVELLQRFDGDLSELVPRILENGGEYLQATVIKAVYRLKMPSLKPNILKGLSSRNDNMRTACVRALAYLADPQNEQLLITATNDRSWIVRSAAVKGLGRLRTPNSMKALVKAVGDSEWWVRYNAACTLVESDVTMDHVEQVLNGYDKYAADSIKYALYKKYNLQSGTPA